MYRSFDINISFCCKKWRELIQALNIYNIYKRISNIKYFHFLIMYVLKKCYRGLTSYAKQLMLLRLIGHLKFAYVKLDIIKITMHPENDTVQVRWRIRGVTGWKVFTMFWKFWKIHEAIGTNQEA